MNWNLDLKYGGPIFGEVQRELLNMERLIGEN